MEGGVADILMETVQSYDDDPLGATSPPGLAKVAAQSEAEGGYLTPGMKADAAEKHTRGAKSELLLHSACETREFKESIFIGNSESRPSLPFVTAQMPFPPSARFYFYKKSKGPKPRHLLFQSIVRWQCS